MMPRRPVRFSLPGTCARASDKGGPTPNFVSALRGQAEALPTAYVSELDDRTTRLGRATSYNMHGDGWSTSTIPSSRSVRAFGKDRARETQAPARSILAAVPTPLGPPVGCHPTPSDGIAYPDPTYVGSGRERG